MNILVTGGAGYIGSHVVLELCDAGYNVIVLDNLSSGHKENVDKRARFIKGDIRIKSDLKAVFKLPIDIVFHFAALKAAGDSMVIPENYAENNILGTINLLNLMVKKNVEYFIFSSSAAIYGDPKYLPIDEDHPLSPTNYYGFTKLVIEQNLQWFSNLNKIHFAALRYFNATGYDINNRLKRKESNPANLTPIIMEVASGNRSKLQVFGNNYDTPDGSCIRDYIHVTDLTKAHIAAMEYIISQKENCVVNLGTGQGYSVFQMINAAEKIIERKIPYEIAQRRHGDPAQLIAGSKKAGEILGWKTIYSDLNSIFETMKQVYL